MVLFVVFFGLFIVIMNHIYDGENWLSFIISDDLYNAEGSNEVVLLFVIIAVFIIIFFSSRNN